MAKKDVQNSLSYGIVPGFGKKYESISKAIQATNRGKFFQGENQKISEKELLDLFIQSVEGLEDSEEIKSELIDIFSEPENIQALRQMIAENSTDVEHLLHGFRKLGNVLQKEKKIQELQKQIDKIKLKQYVEGSNLSKASSFIIQKVQNLESKIKEIEGEKEKLLQTKEVVAAYEFRKISTYSHILNEGKLVYAPSVLAQKQELCDKVTSGQSVLLSGPVGTGKTKIAKNIYEIIYNKKKEFIEKEKEGDLCEINKNIELLSKKIQKINDALNKKRSTLILPYTKSINEYDNLDASSLNSLLEQSKNELEKYKNKKKNIEKLYDLLQSHPIIGGNEETSIRELLSKPIQMSNKNNNEEAFTYLDGYLVRCLRFGLPLIIDESNRTPPNYLSSLKKYFAYNKGEIYTDEVTGKKFQVQGPLQVILTANEGAKYAAHTQKFQDQIKREITRENIGYFPEDEMYDMLKAKLYTEPGIAYVQREDLEHTLPNLIRAVSQVNELYLKGGDYSLKDGSTSSVKIKGTVFDTKRFLELVDRSKIGTENTFLEELNKNIVHFISNEVDDDTDRKILCQIFGAKGLIWKENIPEILSGNTQLQQSELSSSLASTKNQAINSIYGQNKNGERFLNPRELATGYGTLGAEHRLANFEELDRDDNGTKIKAFKKSINQLFNPIKDREIVSMMNKLDEKNLDDFISKVVVSFFNDGTKKNLNEFSSALRELSPEKYDELDKELQKLGYNLHSTQKSTKNLPKI